MSRYSRNLTLGVIEGRPDDAMHRRRGYVRAGADNRDPATKALPPHLGGCWCGNPQPWHDWAGKADGAPHPREFWWPA